VTAIALDANLLLLWVVGNASRAALQIHKRLKAYEAQDLDLLIEIVSSASGIIGTPNAWTEVSNLATFGIVGDYKDAIHETLALSIASTSERYSPSSEIAQRPDFSRLGLADCAWLAVLTPSVKFLTVYLKLLHAAHSHGLDAINFNHLRRERLLGN
jgi:hypothetical protein